MSIKKLLKASFKHKEFDAQKEVYSTNKAGADLVEEYNTALTEIELRDR